MFDYLFDFTNEQLDFFLEKGWYRMDDYIFTADTWELDGELKQLLWMRYDLHSFSAGREAKKIQVKNNAFSVEITSPIITKEIEDLFKGYQQLVPFHPGGLMTSLYQPELQQLFNTHLVLVRDQQKLIGAGFFDVSPQSSAGILNFYHPDYKKFSLGKYIYLQQLQYSIAQGKKYYYPGYIVAGDPVMDYKLFADKNSVEVLNWSDFQWTLFND